MSNRVVSTESGFSASTPSSQATSSDSDTVGSLGSLGVGAPVQAGQEDALRTQAHLIVVPEPQLFLAPELCACCMLPASQSYLVRGTWGQEVQVNYCEDCLRHASAVRTRVLAVCLASSSLGVTLAVALPVVQPTLSMYGLSVSAVLAALIPVAIAVFWRRRPAVPHSTSGEAVSFRGKSSLYCTSARYARLAARKNGLKLRSLGHRPRHWSSWYWSGFLLTLLALPISIVINMAQLRVLNLTEDDFFLVVDGKLEGLVRRTSAESPAAGRDVRLAAGQRHLMAVSQDGTVVYDSQVSLLGGAQHLFAPASPGTCFWIESTSYGRQKPDAPRRRELERGAYFWVLPSDVDIWFAPSPLPVGDDNRSSGGKLTALRQAPCAASPL